MDSENIPTPTPAGNQGDAPQPPYQVTQAQPTMPQPGVQTASTTQSTQAAPAAQTTAAYSTPNVQYGYQQPVTAVHAASAQKASKGTGVKTFFLAFLGAALACILAVVLTPLFGGSSGKSIVGSGSTVTIGSTENAPVVADDTTQLAEKVSEKCLPSIVNIDVYTQQSSYGSFFGYSSGTSSQLTETALGSGIIISDDGYILTNYHVIEDAQKLTVNIEGETYEATVTGTDASSDLAVLKVEASNLTAIEIGQSSSLKQGQWVMSLGSPFGLEQSVATGIVSATSRTVDAGSSSGSSSQTGSAIYTNMIQTDAAINPGNSGGALVDGNGKLIGINTLIASSSGNYSGVGFAIPVDYAINIAQQIIDGKTPTHAQLGVEITTVTSAIAQRNDLPVSSGAYVTSVYSGSGAEAAGMQQGDIITNFNGQAVTSASGLIASIRSTDIGETVDVEINRSGQTQTLKVTLGSDETESPTLKQSSASTGGSGSGYTTYGSSSQNAA